MYTWVDFTRILESDIPSTANGDRMRWKLKRNGYFHIQSFYNKLRGSSSIVFLGKVFGKAKAPRRVFIFVWIVTWNRIFTGDNLRLTGFDFVD